MTTNGAGANDKPARPAANRRLTNRQRAFVDHYLRCLNATEAAKKAGYRGNYDTLRSIGSENLTKPNIARHISEHFTASAMSRDEALQRLAEQGRVNIGDFFMVNQEGKLTLDFARVMSHGYLIKSLTWTKTGPRIELHDAQRAIELIAKHHGAFVDRQELDVTSGGEPMDITIREVVINLTGADNGDSQPLEN